ncbi:NAD(P)/FAD-dependent oxidoreductase [Antrihabitans sp. YC2-6]|uniref:flavin-containing monooxygenase n=1 Tax=Antrihabitans sp. YC2-6 TaxID=2799498 RepID=UPI0018F5FE6F|nr:NAD(P)/FAD-dependent oxidoreductase [Antrihabitans sp. YC2-6]MBJ8346705.1 NAD(P)/FAD-dependent oxidoreductase [Antrihabitans sp. YC2-6]
MSVTPDHEVVVIGAGPGGIATGVKLKQAGIDDFVIIDRASGPGGTWHEYTYPGISVDLPVVLYQFTFDRSKTWTNLFPPGAEIQRYHADVATRHGLDPHFRFGIEIERQIWDDAGHHWTLHTARGDIITARFIVVATGGFLNPKDAPIPGLDTYNGLIQRPGRWNNEIGYRGLRVGIVGTGASAVQIIAEIAPQVQSLTVFQRTPPWVFPRPRIPMQRFPFSLTWLPGVVPLVHFVGEIGIDIFSQSAAKLSPPKALIIAGGRTFDAVAKALYRPYLYSRVRNREARRALRPNYGPAAKRPTFNSAFLPTFDRDNVHLVTEAADHFTEHGLVTASGAEHELDLVVMATGHEMFTEPMDYHLGTIVGRDGFDLAQFWRANGMQAYDSVSVPGVPNRWMTSGPYAGGSTGWHDQVERAADHAITAIKAARERGATLVEVHKHVHDAYHRAQHRYVRPATYYFTEVNKHVNTYYRNSHGDSPIAMVGGVFRAKRRARTIDNDVYRFERVAAVTERRSAAAKPVST